jgi:chromosome segregation protein
MTPRLTRLRIAGFKSFAEPVSLDILPGLTGIVGPNGCGKSNVVEALRWAMGETSARSLRGGEMDDVIFAGTTARPSRNLAEVTITLERAGEEGVLPQPFDAESELQITRRIERGAGSQFRANGREMRARDVQTLYADLASGARSSGMVSQGRVSQLVNARPEERRQVLEEAAGITGLHARRHEAELKLRAAEQNVLRSEDLRTQLEASREALRRQARQAARYRNISGFIRAAEAEHLAVLYAQAQRGLAAAQEARGQAQDAADAAAEEIRISGEALEEAEAALPGPREAEAQARSVLERRRVEAESLAAESERVAREAAEAESRLLELEADCAAALRSRADANASVERLGAEAQRLAARLGTLPDEVLVAREGQLAARGAADAAQRAADVAAAAASEAQAQARQARLTLEAAESRAASMRAQHAEALGAHAAAQAALVGEDRILAAEQALREAEAMLAGARQTADRAEAERAAADRALLAAQSRAEQAAAEAAAAKRTRGDAAARAHRLSEGLRQAEATLEAFVARRISGETLAGASDAVAAAEAALAGCEAGLEAAERAVSEAMGARAEAARRLEDIGANLARAEAALTQANARARAVEAEAAQAEAAQADAMRDAPDAGKLAEAEAARAEAEQVFAAGSEALERLRAGRAQAAQALADARTTAASAEAEAARLAAEAEGLRAALGEAGDEAGILAALVVPEGLEAALGAVLGDASDASLDQSAQKFFRELPPLESEALALPPGSQRLDMLVEAPAALARVLAACVLLDPAADGEALQAALPRGMVAVSREGGCWRWDGQVVRAGAPNAAAVRLRQKNRLQAVMLACDAAAEAAEVARAQCDAAARDDATAQTFELAARETHAASEARLRAARDVAAGLAAQAAQAEMRLSTLMPIVERLASERRNSADELAHAQLSLASLPTSGQAQASFAEASATADRAARALEAARSARAEARAGVAKAQAEAARLRELAREAEQSVSSQTIVIERARADHAEAVETLARAEAAEGALPDEGELLAARASAQTIQAACAVAESECRESRANAERALDLARESLSALRTEAAQAESRFFAHQTMLGRALADLDEAGRQVKAAADHLTALPDVDALTEAAAAAQSALEEARHAASSAESARNVLEVELRQAETGYSLAAHDLAAWQTRYAEAAERADNLATRRDAARLAHQALADAPAVIAARAEKSSAALEAAEAMHRVAHERVQAAEQRVRALSLARRDAELQTATRRETVLRAEASCEAAAGALAAVLARAAERLGEDAVLPEAETIGDDSEERARKKFERLSREREEMGPVNLRAEMELEELDQRLSALEQEREELATAIAKLRGSIGHLNREGRARLEAVFTEVDQHFRTLFTRMMGGGRAHLALTGSDDPLLAGLEIFAEPPGKKLAALSLLSGGEQALTALSLIFAVFRCTPAPVSVLDEVDAPLDDANVERFCTLLDDVVRDTGTRFLVVTHHQLTMSRMDRLFGVTMQERGISRLLSVDLQRAAAMVEPQLQAAE